MVKNISLVLVLLMFIFTSANSQPYWTQTSGPTDGDILCLAYNSSNNFMYAGLSNQDPFSPIDGLFRSNDNFQNYDQPNSGNSVINSIYVDASNKVYIAGNNQVNYSTNNGADFTSMNLYGALSILAKDGFIFAGRGGVYRTSNYGLNWTIVSSTNHAFYALSIDSSGNIYAGSNRGIFKSTNNGFSFDSLPIINSPISSIAISNTYEIYAGLKNEGILKSTTSGNTWDTLNVPFQNVNSLVLKNNNIYACTPTGIYYSTNSGSNWLLLTNYILDVSSLAFDNNSIMVAGTNSGIYRSTDNGNNWIASAFRQSYVMSMCTDSIGYVYATSQILNNKFALWKTTDNGNNWKRLYTTNRVTIGVELTNNGYIFLSSFEGIHRSTNGGISFESTPMTTSSQGLITLDSGIVIAGTNSNVAYRTSDYGVTWQTIPSITENINRFAKKNNQVVYAGTANGKILKSTNKGISWNTVYTGYDGVYSISANKNGYIFASAPYLQLSTNDGLTWTPTGPTLLQYNCTFVDNSNVLYVSITSTMMKSTNNGVNYTSFNSGAFGNYYQIITNKSGYLFLKTGGNSVFRTINPVTSVQNISSEIPSTFMLFQNYPNPFNPATNITFDIPQKSFVKLIIYDISGKELIALINEDLTAGSYNYQWDASNFTSGVYFYRLEANDFIETKRMVLIK